MIVHRVQTMFADGAVAEWHVVVRHVTSVSPVRRIREATRLDPTAERWGYAVSAVGWQQPEWDEHTTRAAAERQREVLMDLIGAET